MKQLMVVLLLAVLLAAGCAGQGGGPPVIPHSIADRSDCKSCHEKGTNGAKVTKHPERPNCTSCHKAKNP